ncbi:hypothetical protein CQW23_21584 [Capsicum baccatum]|uniref:Uncharacterized protein n=1 Tax=Capsicum baccatum TaxID=33114 RepID=A0A2G2VYH1_CAPBA|nr:hypothetical protein CQW23_21584 [Capsicum baccatum]
MFMRFNHQTLKAAIKIVGMQQKALGAVEKMEKRSSRDAKPITSPFSPKVNGTLCVDSCVCDENFSECVYESMVGIMCDMSENGENVVCVPIRGEATNVEWRSLVCHSGLCLMVNSSWQTENQGCALKVGHANQWRLHRLWKFDYSVHEDRANQFYVAIRKYYPGLKDGSLEPGYAGIRPNLFGPEEGPTDFVVQVTHQTYSKFQPEWSLKFRSRSVSSLYCATLITCD